MNVVVADSLLLRLRGLFGRQDFNGLLLLERCNDVHTFGMRHPIDVAFLLDDGTVVQSHRRVGPHKRLRCAVATATLERFSTEACWPEPGDVVDLKGARS